jgi:hypothetical protein
MGPGGPPQFPSADANQVLALLSTLVASDQQKLGEAQMQAIGGAFSQLMAGQPDPAAAAAASGPPPPAGPPMGNDPNAGPAY